MAKKTEEITKTEREIEQEEFAYEISRTEPSILEKMMRVGILGEGFTEVLVEKGYKEPDLTYTVLLRELFVKFYSDSYSEDALARLFCYHGKCIGRRWVFIEKFKKERGDFIYNYNKVLASMPWLLDVFSEAQAKSFVTEVLDKLLTPEQSKTIQLRYGFFDGRCWTLEEIKNELGIRRVDKIERIAVRKLMSRRCNFVEVAKWYHSVASVKIINELKLITNKFVKEAEKTYMRLRSLENVKAELMQHHDYFMENHVYGRREDIMDERFHKTLRSIEDVMTGLMENAEYRRAEKVRELFCLTKFGSSSPTPDIANINVFDLGFSPLNGYYQLKPAKVNTVGDLLKLTRPELIEIYGQKSAAEVEAKLLSLGFEFFG